MLILPGAATDTTAKRTKYGRALIEDLEIEHPRLPVST